MTRRDGDISSKMPRMDRGENSCENSPGNPEKGLDLTDIESKPPASGSASGSKHGKPRHPSSSGYGSDGSFHNQQRDSSKSISLPGSRAGSRPGSRPGSRIHSRTNSQESIIDLFDCMTLTYGQDKSNDGHKGIQLVPGKGIQFISPKPKQFRNQRWTWHDKVRINSAIWRAWHMQYIKGKKPVVCHFTAPLLEKQGGLNPDVIQAGRGYTGSIHWNQSQVDNVVSHYRRWRLRSKDVLQTQSHVASALMGSEEEDHDAEENAIDLDMPHPPLSPMFAKRLANDDMPLKDFSDTLFISTGKKFNVPHPKKITQHVYNADIIQPGLMQLEPDFDDDFMDTLESLTDILMKTPTKPDHMQGFNLSADFPTCFLNSDSLSSMSEAMELASADADRPIIIRLSDVKRRGLPMVIQSNANPQTSVFPVSIQPSVPHVARGLNFTSQTSPSQQHQQQQQQQNQQQHQQQHKHQPQQRRHQQQQQQQQQQSIFHQTSSGVFVTNNSQSTYVVTCQQPTAMSTSSQPLRTGFIPLSEAATVSGGAIVGGAQGGSVAAGGFDPNRVQSPSLMQALTGNYNMTLPQLNSAGFQCVGDAGFTPIVSTATVPSHSISSVQSKVEPLSPTPSNRPACQVMGVLNEAIDVLAYQLPMSPSKMIPPLCTVEWNATTQADNMSWSLANSVTTASATYANAPASIPEGLATHPFAVSSHQTPVFSSGEPVQRKFHPGHDSMEFEAISPASRSGTVTPTGAMTPPTKTNKRDRDGNFSRSNSTSPRSSFTSHYPESVLHAALGQSDVKDLGMLSPSSMADREGAFQTVSSASYPSTAASSAASSPGTPHNEMSETASLREFEFPTQKAKRQKTPDTPSQQADKETRRRLKHLKSEHKRRFNIQTGLDEMQVLVPSLKNTPEGTKISTAILLIKAHEHIVNLKEDFNEMKKVGENLKAEIETLNDDIEKCQDELPDSGAPVNPRNDRQMQAMLDTYIKERSTTNWKFWIFSMIVRPLFETYLNAVCDNPSTDFDTAVTEWIEEHCRLRPLRTVVLSALRQVSKRTSVLTDPSKLPDQVSDIVKKESTSSGGNT